FALQKATSDDPMMRPYQTITVVISLLAVIAIAPVVLAAPASAPASSQGGDRDAAGTPSPVTPAPSAPTAPVGAAPPAAGAAGETDAATALERALAAYEYGDMDLVVEAARPVAEGRAHPSDTQRVQALRLLGIGLFLTGRHEGAET